MARSYPRDAPLPEPLQPPGSGSDPATWRPRSEVWLQRGRLRTFGLQRTHPTIPVRRAGVIVLDSVIAPGRPDGAKSLDLLVLAHATVERGRGRRRHDRFPPSAGAYLASGSATERASAPSRAGLAACSRFLPNSHHPAPCRPHDRNHDARRPEAGIELATSGSRRLPDVGRVLRHEPAVSSATGQTIPLLGTLRAGVAISVACRSQTHEGDGRGWRGRSLGHRGVARPPPRDRHNGSIHDCHPCFRR